MANKPLYKNRHKRKAIRAVEKGAKTISLRRLIYKWGGGRNFSGNCMFPPPQSGEWTDCSGYASWLVERIEEALGIKLLKNGCGNTISLMAEGHEGESDWFTLFIKDDHIIVRLRRRLLDPKRLIYGAFRWVECGGSDNPQLGEGPAFFNPSPSRIAEFTHHRYFKVL